MHPRRPGILMLLIAIVLFVTAAMYAQPGSDQPGNTLPGGERLSQSNRPGPLSAAIELDRLTRTMKSAFLPLTDMQKAAVLGVLEDRDKAMDTLYRSHIDQSSAGRQMHALLDASRTAVRAALTDTQAKVFDSMQPKTGTQKAESDLNPGAFPQSNKLEEKARNSTQSANAVPSPTNPMENDERSLIDANTGGSPQPSQAQ